MTACKFKAVVFFKTIYNKYLKVCTSFKMLVPVRFFKNLYNFFYSPISGKVSYFLHFIILCVILFLCEFLCLLCFNFFNATGYIKGALWVNFSLNIINFSITLVYVNLFNNICTILLIFLALYLYLYQNLSVNSLNFFTCFKCFFAICFTTVVILFYLYLVLIL